MLHDGAGVDVEIGAGGLGVAEALHEQGPPPLQQGEPGLGRQVPGEGQAQAEAPGVVGGPAALQQLDEERAAGVGDAVHLAAPPGPGGGVPAGPQDRPLAAQRARGGRRRGRCRRAAAARRAFGGHHRARLLQAGEGGVDGAERDVGQQPQVLTQLAPDLVPVQVPLFEEAEDGHVQHDG